MKDQYLAFFEWLRSWLVQIHPSLGPHAFLTLMLWLSFVLVRRYRPSWWAWMRKFGPDPEHAITHFAQATPSIVIGALFAGLTTLEVEQLAWGALAGLAAPLWHHALKALPVPYRGILKDKAAQQAKAWKAGNLSLLVMCALCLSGCAQFWKVARTADDVAREACALFFAEHQGINFRDAAKTYCDTREAIDAFLASQNQAGEELAAAQGLSRK